MKHFEKQRELMIEDQLKKCGIKDPKVLLAMEMVPREMFLAEDMALFA